MTPRTPKPGPKTPAATGEVFLSPRVVDARAFDDLAGRLRTLVDQAGEQAAVLQGAMANTEQLGARVREIEAAQQHNMELAARALQSLEQRAAKAGQMLEAALRAAEATREFEANAAAMIDRQAAELRARLERVVREVQVSASDSLSRLEIALERADAVVGTPETPGSLSGHIERAEAAREEAAIATGQFDALRRQADSAQRSLAQGVEAVDSCARRLADARATVLEQAEQAARSIRETSAARADVAQSILEAEAAAERVRGLIAVLEPWRPFLEAEGGEPARMPPAIEGIIQTVRSELQVDLSMIAGALRTAAAKADRAAERVAAPAPAIVADPTQPDAASKPVVVSMSRLPSRTTMIIENER